MRPGRVLLGVVAALLVAVILGLGVAWGWPALQRHWASARSVELADAAEERIALGDGPGALELLRQSVNARPGPSTSAVLRRLITVSLGPEDDPDTASDACELLLSLTPSDGDALFAAGLALARQGRHLEAAERFLQAAESRDEWPEARANAGLCYLSAGDGDRAAPLLEEAAGPLAVTHPEILTALGRSLLRILPPNPDAAEEAFARATALDPTDGEAQAGMGIVQYLRGDLEGALSRLAEAALLAPLDADVLATQGALLARAGRDTEAEEAFHRALAVEPGHATARYDLGCLYLRRREGLLAEVQFRIACQAMPDDPLARLGWAMALRLEGRDEEAATQLTRSLALSPPGGAVSLARSELLALSSGAEEPMSLPPGSSGE